MLYIYNYSGSLTHYLKHKCFILYYLRYRYIMPGAFQWGEDTYTSL